VGLADDDLPAAFRAADRTAIASQARTMRWLGWQLALLVLAAIFGVIPGDIGDLRVGPLLALVVFAVAVILSWRVASEAPSAEWYRGRAGAESVKTLAWRYAVCGDPFVSNLTRREVDLLFEERLSDVINGLEELDWRYLGEGEEITDRMREVRASGLDERKRAYETGRLRDQQAWYARKSEFNRRRSEQWGWAAVGATVIGFIGAVLRIPTDWGVDVDLLGIAATFAAAVAAWTQSKQFRVLTTSYAVTAHELATIISIRLPLVEKEEDWAGFVREAESAISREHSLWLARRGAAG